MTIERSLDVPSDPHELKDYLQSLSNDPSVNRLVEIGNLRYDRAMHYVLGDELDKKLSRDAPNAFRAGMPGISSLSELAKQLDVGRWKLMVGQHILHLEVRTRLSCWW